MPSLMSPVVRRPGPKDYCHVPADFVADHGDGIKLFYSYDADRAEARSGSYRNAVAYRLVEVVIQGSHLVSGGRCNHVPSINAMEHLNRYESAHEDSLQRVAEAAEALAKAKTEFEDARRELAALNDIREDEIDA